MHNKPITSELSNTQRHSRYKCNFRASNIVQYYWKKLPVQYFQNCKRRTPYLILAEIVCLLWFWVIHSCPLLFEAFHKLATAYIYLVCRQTSNKYARLKNTRTYCMIQEKNYKAAHYVSIKTQPQQILLLYEKKNWSYCYSSRCYLYKIWVI